MEVIITCTIPAVKQGWWQPYAVAQQPGTGRLVRVEGQLNLAKYTLDKNILEMEP